MNASEAIFMSTVVTPVILGIFAIICCSAITGKSLLQIYSDFTGRSDALKKASERKEEEK